MTSQQAGVGRWAVFGYQPRAAWVWLAALVTGVYLLIECGFNSRLLDVVGGTPDAAAVEAIETYGRLISGFAVTLVAWPFLLKRGRSWIGTTFALTIVSGVLVAIVYFGELRLVDWVVDSSTAEQRYVATNLAVLQTALVKSAATLDDLPLSTQQLNAPDGKTFLAIFPLMAFSTKDLDRKIRTQKPAILLAVSDLAYGGWSQNYNNFIASRAELIRRYNNDYLRASDQYNRSLARIPEQQQQAWSDYARKLQRHRMSPEGVAPMHWARIRQDVRNSGVPVDSHWVPYDHVGFNRAIEKKIRSEADSRFQAGMRAQFAGAEGMRPNLDKNLFFSHPSTQKIWRDKLSYEKAPVFLPVDLPGSQEAPQYFKRAVYTKVLDWQVQEQLRQYDAPVFSFADGGAQEHLGKEKMRAMAVPPIALAFSILGALVHLIKIALFSFQLGFERGFRTPLAKGICVPVLAVGLLSAFYFIPTSSITTQPLYRYFEDRGATLGGTTAPTHFGRAAMFYARSVIHAQVLAYPVFEKVRTSVLAGYKFGYHPTTATEKGAL